MIMDRASSRTGFTIIEALVTLAIGSVALLIVASMVGQALQADDAVCRMDAELRDIISLSNLMRRDVATLSANSSSTRPLSGDCDGDVPTLRIMSSAVRRNDDPAEQAAEITPSTIIYTTHMETDGSITYLRGELSSSATAEESSPVFIPIARGLSKVQIEYFDGSNWQNIWERATLPHGIRVHLARMVKGKDRSDVGEITFHISTTPGGAS